MNSTYEVSASLTNQWPPEDYWHSSQGQKLVINNTFLELESVRGIDQGRTRARSDTALDDMMDKRESHVEFSACDNLNSRRTCSTKDSDTEDEKVQTHQSSDEDTEHEEDEQEILQQEEEKEEDIEYQRVLTTQGEQRKVEQNLASQHMGSCVAMMGSPNLMQQTNSSPPMMMGTACSSTLCFYVPMSSFYPYGVGMEQATQPSVDACGYPQFTTSPCSSVCPEDMPQHASAEELNARAAELRLAAEKCTAAAQQMTAAANSQGTPSQVASMQSASKQPSWRTARPPVHAAKAEGETSVMFRNLPNNQERDTFAALLDAEGFAGLYDFLYLPWDFHRLAGLGYAFVNFTESKYAEDARSHFNGFTRWGFASEKVCEVCPSDRLNGLEAHVERYRNSPVMHPGVPEICRPLLLLNGIRIPFPPPTKPLRPPRMKRCAPVTH